MGADERPEVVEAASEEQVWSVCESRLFERGLPELEGMNYRGEFGRIPGRGRLHICEGRTRAIQRSEPLH